MKKDHTARNVHVIVWFLAFAALVLFCSVVIYGQTATAQDPPRHPCEHPETWKIDREYGTRRSMNCDWKEMVVPASQCAAYEQHYGLTCERRRTRGAKRRQRIIRVER